MLRYKVLIIIAVVCSSLSITHAQTKSKKSNLNPAFYIGVHTGMDIGAAAPYPLSSMGEDSKISAVPYLTPALGFSANMEFTPRWSASAEITYKKFGIEAKAWVTDQRFIDRDNPDRILSFRGTADIGMKFTMLEVPLYIDYSFGKRYNSHVILGAYYAQVFTSDFNATPKKGMLTNVNNPEDFAPVTPDEPFTQDFSNDMDSWDVGMLVGYKTKIIERVELGLRLSVGFKDIFKDDAKSLPYKMLHMRGSIVLSYQLFRFYKPQRGSDKGVSGIDDCLR